MKIQFHIVSTAQIIRVQEAFKSDFITWLQSRRACPAIQNRQWPIASQPLTDIANKNTKCCKRHIGLVARRWSVETGKCAAAVRYLAAPASGLLYHVTTHDSQSRCVSEVRTQHNLIQSLAKGSMDTGASKWDQSIRGEFPAAWTGPDGFLQPLLGGCVDGVAALSIHYL